MKTLIFGGDWASIKENYTGPSVYEFSMVVPLKKVTSELEEKVNKFTENYHNEHSFSSSELIKYCIDNDLVLDNRIDILRKEYNL